MSQQGMRNSSSKLSQQRPSITRRSTPWMSSIRKYTMLLMPEERVLSRGTMSQQGMRLSGQVMKKMKIRKKKILQQGEDRKPRVLVTPQVLESRRDDEERGLSLMRIE